MKVRITASLALLAILVCAHPAAAQEAGGAPAFEGRSAKEWIAVLGAGDLAAKRKAAWALWNLAPDAPGAAVPLARAVRTDDQYLRETASKAFGKMGDARAAAVSALAEALGDERAAVRRVAAVVLQSLAAAAAPAIDAIARALEDPDPIVRANAAAGLGWIGEPAKKSLPRLVKLLDDPDANVRKWATNSLTILDRAALGRAALPLLDSEDPVRRAEAAAALGVAAPKDHLAALAKLLDDDDAGVRARAVASIGYAGADAAPHLEAVLARLEDDSAEVRLAAVQAVWGIGEPAAVPGVTAALSDEDPRIRSTACSALATLGKEDEATVPALMGRFEDAEAGVVASACIALSTLGVKASAAVPRLLELANSEDSWTRTAALQGLEQIAPADERSVAAFIAALANGDQNARVTASRGLTAAKEKAATAVPAMIACYEKNADAGTRVGIALALANLGPAGKAAGPTLRKGMAADAGTEPVGYGNQAAFALAMVTPDATPDAVRYIVASFDGPLRVYSAAHFLGRIGPAAKDAVPALLGKMREGGSTESILAAAIVKIAGGDGEAGGEALALLVRRLEEAAAPGPSPTAVVAWIRMLGDLGPLAAKALPALEKLSTHPGDSVRKAAAEAARSIRGE